MRPLQYLRKTKRLLPKKKFKPKKKKKEVIRKEKKDESHDYNESKENGSDDEKIDTQIDANVSKDMFNNSDEDMHCEDVDEDDVQKTVKLKNDKSKQQMNSVDIQINGGKEGKKVMLTVKMKTLRQEQQFCKQHHQNVTKQSISMEMLMIVVQEKN